MNENEFPSIRLTSNLMYFIALPPVLPQSNILKHICILYIVLFNITAVYLVYFQQNGRFNYGYRIDSIYRDVPTRFLNSSGSIVLAVMSVVISCALVLFHPKKHRKILKNIQELNRLLSYNFPKIDKKKKTIIRLAALHVCFSIAYFLDYYLWVARKSLTIYKYFGFDHILRYRFIIFAHYMANVVRELNYGAKYMNKILKCANKRFEGAAKKRNLNNLIGIIHNDVAMALKAHTMIADGICCYNKIFGWTFVLMHIDSLITFLMYFQLSLKINTEQLDLIRSIFLTWMVLMMIFSVVSLCYV